MACFTLNAFGDLSARHAHEAVLDLRFPPGVVILDTSPIQPPIKPMSAVESTSGDPASPTPASLYRAEHQRDVLNRLKRIEGQIRGLVDMIESGRDCEDVAQQMTATRRAMDKAFYRMMTCTVIEAVTASGDHDQARSEIERRAKLLEKYG